MGPNAHYRPPRFAQSAGYANSSFEQVSMAALMAS